MVGGDSGRATPYLRRHRPSAIPNHQPRRNATYHSREAVQTTEASSQHDTKLWRVVHYYVDQARARANAAGVTRVAIDETAARRGHDYISLFVDIEQARVLFATEGRDASTVAAFAQDLTAHRGVPEAVSEVCIDMSPAFIKGVADNLPEAAITFDKFHAVKIINEAVDQVRRAEQKTQT